MKHTSCISILALGALTSLLVLAACSSGAGEGTGVDAGPSADGGRSTPAPDAGRTFDGDASTDASQPDAPQAKDAGSAVVSAICTFDAPITNFSVHEDLEIAVSPDGGQVYVLREGGFGTNTTFVRRYKMSGDATCSLTLDTTFGSSGELTGFSNANQPYAAILVATDTTLSAAIGRYTARGMHRYWPPSNASEDCAKEIGDFWLAPDGKTGYAIEFESSKLTALTLGATCTSSDVMFANLGQYRGMAFVPGGNLFVLGFGQTALYDVVTKALVRTFPTPNADTIDACGQDACVYDPGSGVKAFQRYDLNGTKKSETSLLTALPAVAWNTLGTAGRISQTGIGYVTYVDKPANKLGIARVVLP